MRKIILHAHMSLDGIISEQNHWMKITDEMLNDGSALYETLDTVMFGSKTYPGMATYWTNALKNPISYAELEFARQLNSKKKLVLSRSSQPLVWENSSLLQYTSADDLRVKLDELKNESGENISVACGVGLWHFFIENSLFDDLLLYIHPALAGHGERLFTEFHWHTSLSLVREKTYEDGTKELYYEKTS
ncbi:dihydrofolate reductase family protein [Chitinophaga sp. Hz27]|uniref:dihydrofolate reductase family protein n=1 Tax=Chitinophaga sp. Hz27 TaxID=3347169 RepID=UPI0035D850FF